MAEEDRGGGPVEPVGEPAWVVHAFVRGRFSGVRLGVLALWSVEVIRGALRDEVSG